jgi:hypothetical protein
MTDAAATASGRPLAVITVHGTNDSAPQLDGHEKWWQTNSSFCLALTAALHENSLEAKIIPFIWTGKNNVSDREQAAADLASAIRATAKTHGAVHIIAHSHGGNVANDAAILLRWGRRKRDDPIAGLTTVGTPFLSYPVSAFQRAGAYAFFGISLIALTLIIATLGLSVTRQIQFHDFTKIVEVVAAFAPFAIVALIMVREAQLGVRRVSRPGQNPATKASVHCIWHPSDEAISALKAVSALKIEAFSPGSLWIGSRNAGILWAVRIVLLFVAVAAALLATAWAGGGALIRSLFEMLKLDAVGAWLLNDKGLGIRADDPGTYLTALDLILLIPAALWIAVYLIVRFVTGFLPDRFARGFANDQISSLFRSMAFGSVGDQRIADVSVTPYAFEAIRVELTGECAERLQANAEGAATGLLEKYRWEIFNTSADHTKLFGQIPNDAMTWKSLIHTTYFGDAQVIELIRAHILGLEVWFGSFGNSKRLVRPRNR